MKCISWFKMCTRIIVTIPSFLQDLVYLLYQQTKDLRGDFSFKWIIKNTSNWHINDTNCVLFQTIGLDKIWFCMNSFVKQLVLSENRWYNSKIAGCKFSQLTIEFCLTTKKSSCVKLRISRGSTGWCFASLSKSWAEYLLKQAFTAGKEVYLTLP